MKKHLTSVAAIALLVGSAGVARADDSVTVNGITFYGTIDVGVGYDTHGAPSTQYGSVGTPYLVSKGGNRATWNMTEAGLSQSTLGLKGAQDLGDGWTGIFKLETGFNPTSGQIVDGNKTLASQAGRPLQQQTYSDDSSQNGQTFTKTAYVGISNQTYGTLMLGRQNTLVADQIGVYDPMGGSYAFSVIGFSGAFGGSGQTQDLRWDNAAKYLVSYGPVRFGAMYQFAGDIARNDNGEAFDLGADYAGLSGDVIFTHKKDEIAGGVLSSAQVASAIALQLNPLNTISATVSDNTALAGLVRYTWDKWKFSGGYQYMRFANPASPLANGTTDIGGYSMLTNNTAYNKKKNLQIGFIGAKYAVTSKLDVATAWYHTIQNAYGTAPGIADCTNSTQSGTCAGTQNAISLMADYHFTKKFDVYGGAMYSQVTGGLANGYFHNNNIDPTVGLRYTF